MKALIYGIDGGDNRIFDYFHMPFYQKIKKSFTQIPLNEDLINRGWSEIVTGKEGKDTGGLYISPMLDGSTKFSMKYSISEVPQNTDIQLLWEAIGNNAKVGIMNVPSLNPVAPVNGFAVGSAGAGISKIDQIDSDIAYPQSAIDYLRKSGYIPDIRLGPSGITDVDELFSKLKEMEKKRVDSFIHLANQTEIDFGLLIDRGTTVVQYLFLSEINALMDRDADKTPSFPPSAKIENLLRDFYSFVDDNIHRLYKSLAPDHFILTADHGHEAMTHHCNPNNLLSLHGYYDSGKVGGESFVSHIYRSLFERIPRKYRARIRNLLSSTVVDKVERIGTGFNRENTLAFSHWYMPGIYLNDSRFNGPVRDHQRDSLIEELCKLVNNDEVSIKHGITASRYREKYSSSLYGEKLPDIKLNMPDYIFPTCRGKSYISKNPLYGPVTSLENVQSDMHTGTKGSQPLCLVDPATAAHLDKRDPDNLTVVYKLVKRVFESATQ
ncbi:hypothetical protein [Microbulbifer sp. YPW16]|uniref:hypothetical protein n=1 Tax=Microbulbifer sp. YPW16 TaxID=2904242 RepID=UPI001E46ECD0|nr:hypothetical protein [Microbulbifer sp. YPW16]UHQ54875.1 hypothetical protein LVE68_15410 [Microbulbifer sp. YPW16]